MELWLLGMNGEDYLLLAVLGISGSVGNVLVSHLAVIGFNLGFTVASICPRAARLNVARLLLRLVTFFMCLRHSSLLITGLTVCSRFMIT